jgi:hypothetical protein
MNMFRFMLNKNDLTGTVVEKRIKDIAAEGNEARYIYKLKDSKPQTLSKNNSLYSEANMEHLKKVLQEHINFFGYSNHPDIPAEDNPTSFFHYDEQSEEALKLHGEFMRHNERVLKTIDDEEKPSVEAFDFNFPTDQKFDANLYKMLGKIPVM